MFTLLPTVQKHRKAFTIVELIIVIAVIGILAAILIPTFASIIDKATLSSVTSDVKNLNTAVVAESVADGKISSLSLDEAIICVAKSGYGTKTFICQKEGLDIMWAHRYNKFAVVAAEGSGDNVTPTAILYPQELVVLSQNYPDVDTFISVANLQSTRTIAKVSTATMQSYVDTINTAAGAPVTLEVSSSEQLASLAKMSSPFNDAGADDPQYAAYKKDFANVTIEIQNDIYLGGVLWTPFGESDTNPFKGSIEGNGHSIYGLTNSGYEGGFAFTTTHTQTTGSAFGFIAYPSGDVSIKNLNMENVAINMVNGDNPNDANNGLCVGALVGYVKDNAANNLTIENCMVSGSIKGVNDIGGLVGKFYGKTLKMTNCTNNADVVAELSGKTVKGGGLVGYIGLNTRVATIENLFTNCTNNGSVTITSRDGYTVFAGGLLGGRSSNYGGIHINGFVNNGDISAATSSTQNFAGQITGQLGVCIGSLSNGFLFEGDIALNGSSTAINPSVAYIADSNVCMNFMFGDDVLFGHVQRYNTISQQRGQIQPAIMFVAGTTINGTELTTNTEWSCFAEFENTENIGATTYTFTAAA